MVLTALNKPHAFGIKGTDEVTSWEAPPQDSMVLTGLNYTRHGISVNKEIIEALRQTLTEYEVKTKSDAQHVIGTIQYSHTAFQWDEPESYVKYSSLMRVLTESIKVDEGKRVRWTDECKAACTDLLNHITIRPLAYWSPTDLINNGSCLVTLTT